MAVPAVGSQVGVESIRLALKTEGFYEGTLERLIQDVYYGNMGGEFIDIMANLIFGQLQDAYAQALLDNGLSELDMTDEMRAQVDAFVIEEGNHVDELYRDVVDARMDGEPIEPLLARASLWSNRWNDMYNAATTTIAALYGENLMWEYGDTEHCTTCLALNGIVAFASEWEQVDVHPQGPPNDRLECGGWKCQCSLTVTNQRRSPRAIDSIMGIVGG